jgi:transaldolase/glucose-6-phosphate isomerase
MYVEELIGADTVNTMPPPTMDAFRDHGTARASLEEDIAAPKAVMDALPAGVSMADVTKQARRRRRRSLRRRRRPALRLGQKKRQMVLGSKLNSMSYKVPADLEGDVKAAIEDWRKNGKIRRLWSGDASLWTEADEAKWLGWLNIVASS